METYNNHPKCQEVMEDEKEESTEVKEKVIKNEKEESMEVQEVMKGESTEVKKEGMEVKSTEVKKEVMKTQKEELKLSEEGEFVKLFHEVLQLNRGGLSDEEIAEGVVEAIRYFCEKISGTCQKETYNNPQIVCGFFHRYSPLFAGVTRNKFCVAFRYCEELRSCIHRLDREDGEKKLKIVDVGSGAGSGLVGLYSAIASIYNLDFPFQCLKVTAMDYNHLWRKFFNDIVEKLQDGNYNFGNASKLFKEKDIECSFTEIDVLQDNCEEIKDNKDIKEADIILMKGFLTILKDDDERIAISEALASTMKSGSLLVILESPTYEKYFQVKSLRLVYTTRKFLGSSKDSGSTSQSFRSESEDEDSKYARWEKFKRLKHPDKEIKFYFEAPKGSTQYGIGFCSETNQQIFVLKKLPTVERPPDQQPDKKRKLDPSIE